MRRSLLFSWLLNACVLGSVVTLAQTAPQIGATAQLRLHIVSSQAGSRRVIPAVIWLEPLPGTIALPFISHRQYSVLQKNRTFIPHLQVIPVGTVVQFPNADPFFHNVFSLYDGKRFDLGLYEAGSSKAVTFSRLGVSYIFCDIHPEMSAVVLALSTPLYSVGDSTNSFAIPNIPSGDYNLHLWIEGVPPSVLSGLARAVHIAGQTVDLGTLSVPVAPGDAMRHSDKFGNDYNSHTKSTYKP